jgi:hypothetical protein
VGQKAEQLRMLPSAERMVGARSLAIKDRHPSIAGEAVLT